MGGPSPVASLSLPRGLMATIGAKRHSVAGSVGAVVWSRDVGHLEEKGSFLELSALCQ